MSRPQANPIQQTQTKSESQSQAAYEQQICPAPIVPESRVVQADNKQPTGDRYFSFVCPNPGDYLTNIVIGGGNFVDSVLGKCKNENWFERVGGPGGSDMYANDENGFTKLNVFTNKWIQGLQVFDSQGNQSVQAGIPSNGTKSTLDCGTDKIKGIAGTYMTNYRQSDDSYNYEPYMYAINTAVCSNESEGYLAN